MLFSATIALAAGLAAASPVALAPRDATDVSKGFSLVIDVEDRSKDFNPPVQGKFIGGFRIGAGIDALVADTKPGGPMYLNGTAEETENFRGVVVGDNDFIQMSMILGTSPGSTLGDVPVSIGPGTKALGVKWDGDDEDPELAEAASNGAFWAACNKIDPRYPEMVFLERSISETLPSNCIAIRLITQCADLPDLKPSTPWNRNFAVEVPCYKNALSHLG